MTNSSDVVAAVGEGHETCPGCGGDEWKGARMVVLEGTTFSKGEISGEITDPGAFSGGLRAFLVSDRWFSWNNELEADVELTTTSGLAMAVKKLMVQYASLVQVPPEPALPPSPQPPKGPPKIGFLERVRPLEPSRPEDPELPAAPVDRPWYSHFLQGLKGNTVLMLVGGVGYWFFYAKDNVVPDWAWPAFAGVLLLGVVVSFVTSFRANDEAMAEYEQKRSAILEKHQRACEEFAAKNAKYLVDCKAAAVQEENHKLATIEYERQLADYERKAAEASAMHSKQQADYEDVKRRVLVVRELLWERARVCLRCGNAYFGRA